MRPILTTPPATLPVSLAEVKAQLSIDTDDYDARLAALTAVAVEMVEAYTHRAMITRSYTGYLNWWPRDGRGLIVNNIQLQPSPVISVQSVTTYDDQDNPTVFDASQYYVDTTRRVGRIVLRRGSIWPIPYRTANAIEIAWTAGYGPDPADTPEILRQAVLITVGALNEQRGDLDALKAPALPPFVMGLLQPHTDETVFR